MFNPVPPREPQPQRSDEVAADADANEIVFPGKSRRVLSFAIKRGLILAFGFGVPLGLLIGLAAPSREAFFLEDRFRAPGSAILFWTFATVAAFIPCMIIVCAIAMSVEEIARSIAQSSRRTARTVKKCLQRRFDSHL
jgi:hypothetical protein